MKKILILATVCVVIFLSTYLFFSAQKHQNSQSSQKISDISSPPEPSKKPGALPKKNGQSPTNTISSVSVFFPYWLLPDNADNLKLPDVNQFKNRQISEYIYFGITTDGQAVNKNEPGYLNMRKFADLPFPADSKRLLTLRLINENITLPLLKNPDALNILIKETFLTAEEFGFDGILLDLEVSTLATDELVSNISGLVEQFGEKSKSEDLDFYIAVYGDVFYRKRPYDIKKICQIADKVTIMAYDFHKSFGTPGPNFPLRKADEYDYSFEGMTDDFLAFCPEDKLTIIFGLFGYNWKVDDQNRPLKGASALSYNQARSRYLLSCDLPACQTGVDMISKETFVEYDGEDQYKHKVWFETPFSIEQKIDLSLGKGISSFCLWAWGYY